MSENINMLMAMSSGKLCSPALTDDGNRRHVTETFNVRQKVASVKRTTRRCLVHSRTFHDTSWWSRDMKWFASLKLSTERRVYFPRCTPMCGTQLQSIVDIMSRRSRD